ncbi:MAG TPA: hypothetical protein ENI42_01885 [Thermoplasmatales archaeon]|nr:hypothetical protein [Thermoplasmatales archaeon]
MDVKVEDDISNRFGILLKVINGIYLWITMFFVVTMFPLLLGFSLDNDKLIFATTGVLTFIAIFYSLIISREGNRVIELIENMVQSLDNQPKGNSREKKRTRKIISQLGGSSSALSFVKKIINIDYLLLVTVFSLLFSIIFTLFDFTAYGYLSYFSFALGLSCSSGIVLEWTLIGRIVKGVSLIVV